MGNVLGPRNYSAVTAACMMTRRAVFDQAGGFDEAFPTDFNDVDYCLKVRTRRATGSSWTPYARLIHHESASFGPRMQDPPVSRKCGDAGRRKSSATRTTIPT